MTETPDHGEREHSDLGASSCSRWWNCPGSLRLGKDIPPRSSIYAEEGTAAHELAHICLLQSQHAIEYVDRKINGFDVTPEMAEAVQVYLDVCWDLKKQGAECSTERKFTLAKLKPPAPMFGTADFVAVFKEKKKLVVADLKFGQGVIVEAVDNPQLKYYALGALLTLPPGTPIDEIECIIVQPRGRGYKEPKRVAYSFMDIYLWSEELLGRAKKTREPDAELNPGSWCRFCPASGRCPAEADKNFAVAQGQFTAEKKPEDILLEIRLLSPERKAELLHRAPLIEQTIKALRETAKEDIERGVKIPGWKLVPSEGHRKWKDEESAVQQLTSAAGLTDNEIWTKKLVSPAQAEAVVVQKLRDRGMKAKDAKEKVKGAFGEMTVKPITGNNLVPDTDDRPALPARGEEFTLETRPEA